MARHLNAPIVGVVPTIDDKGYFMVGSDGGVFAFGDAQFEGSCPGIGGCSGPAVAVAPDASGRGYWLVTSTGHVLHLRGCAVLRGTRSAELGRHLHGAYARRRRLLDTRCQWRRSSATGMLHPWAVSPPTPRASSDPATTIFATADGGGYWVGSSAGGLYAFGDAPNDGGLSGEHLNGAIIAATGF